MFARPKDPKVEVWDGPRSGPDACRHFFGADEAHPISTLQCYLDNLVSETSDGNAHVYTDLPVSILDSDGANKYGRSSSPSYHVSYSVTDPSREDREACLSNFVRKLSLKDPKPAVETEKTESDTSSSAWWNFGGASNTSRRSQKGIHLRALKPHLQELRLIKSPAECQLLYRAGTITALGFRAILDSCRPGKTEHELFAAFDGHTRTNGATRIAYVPVVASGRNALTLHYVQNRAVMGDGDLVLIDAGIENNGYVSDVTRTFPVNGRFSVGQRKLYEALLRVQKACVAVSCLKDSGLRFLSIS